MDSISLYVVDDNLYVVDWNISEHIDDLEQDYSNSSALALQPLSHV